MDSYINQEVESLNLIYENIQELVVDDISVEVGDFSLNHISFKTTIGHKYLIQGKNGSGKSTILKAISKFIPIQNGHIYINNYDICKYDSSLYITYVQANDPIFQASFKDNTTMFNTYTLDKLYDYLKLHPNNKINSMLEVEDCTSMSNGEKQIVSLIRAFIEDHPIILFDESFNAIDINQREYFYDMFLNDYNKIIIMISHDYSNEFKQKFDKVFVLNKGEMQ